MEDHRIKWRIRSLYSVIILFIATAMLTYSPRVADAVGWKAGTAKVVVTPPEPAWMAGYGDRDHKSEGKIHDIYVKALAIEDPNGTKAIILTADLIGNSLDFSTRVRNEIERRYGISRKAILLNTSHNHCGPEVRAPQMPLYFSDEQVREIEAMTAWVEQRYIEVVGKAIADMKPAELSFSKGKPVPFSVSRRLPTPEGIAYRSGPSSYYTGGLRDDTVPVLRVAGADGSIKAVLFGYACHPITMTGYMICGDYPGFAQRYIEEAYPGANAMFTQGCTGDLVPNARFQIEYAMGHGRALAVAVKKALDSPQQPITGEIRFDFDEIPLDVEPLPSRAELTKNLTSNVDNVRTKAKYFLNKLDNDEPIKPIVKFPIQVLRIGNEVMMIGLAGEPVVDYAVRFKSEFLTQFTWVMGYCNNMFGYLPTWRVLKEGGYEGGEAMSFMPYTGQFTDTVESKVVNEVRRLVNNVMEKK